ncbi:p53 and DNA damage-regulated protein 1 [Blastocladiella emersonii ATCC 22665]|nr:p53 and DNA damage-regulated protein 1 [Blastocladiella emersonii ATCC 22665]
MSARELGPASDPAFIRGVALRESLAEDIAMAQDMLEELDQRRMANREALGHLLPRARSRSPSPRHAIGDGSTETRRSPSPTATRSPPAPVKGARCWMNLGDLFIRVNKSQAAEMLAKEQKTLEREAQETKEMIKEQMQRFHSIDEDVRRRSQQFEFR